MQITMNKEDSRLTVAVEGRIDTVTAPRLEEEIKNSLDGITQLIIDLKEVSYISSAGLRTLLSLQKKMKNQGVMEIHNVNELVMEIFDVTGFSDVLTIK